MKTIIVDDIYLGKCFETQTSLGAFRANSLNVSLSIALIVYINVLN